MNDSQKVKMNLNIGDQRLTVNVPFDRQDFVRDVEASIDRLYSQWRNTFTSKTDREILAMVTYQFASHYNEMHRSYEQAAEKAAECLKLAEQGSVDRNDEDSIFE